MGSILNFVYRGFLATGTIFEGLQGAMVKNAQKEKPPTADLTVTLGAGHIRKVIIAYLHSHQPDFEPYLANGDGVHYKDMEDYITQMAQDGTWADALVVAAAAAVFQVRIRILKELGTNSHLWIHQGEGNGRIIGLYLRGEHYENLLSMIAIRGQPPRLQPINGHEYDSEGVEIFPEVEEPIET